MEAEGIPMDWDTLFCDLDDFCQDYLPIWRARLLSCGLRKRHREPRLSMSEIMTIFSVGQTDVAKAITD